MRALATILSCAVLAASVSAQTGIDAQQEPKAWSYYATVSAYFVPADDYLSPVFMADRDRLHLEARYNYEGQDTVSAWLGYNLVAADGESWTVTPMLGGVFGDTKGIAAGVELSAAWRSFGFYSEGEHLFAADDDADDFTYFWTEVDWSPLDWLRVGFVSQRTRAWETDLDILRGLLVGFTFHNVSVTTSLFEPGSDDETLVVTAGVEF